ncbi:hypothetical protein ACR9YC_00460 [Parasphingorhabdus sp. DH2-15]|uniref:hypothetical protein n=1 Tax=Parasphingorhabdus sp. DH2-15 TaxID=3444112 RepID=UPI003F68699F
MNKDDIAAKTSDKANAKPSREERLAEQLRANLRRRKAQARALDPAKDTKDKS